MNVLVLEVMKLMMMIMMMMIVMMMMRWVKTSSSSLSLTWVTSDSWTTFHTILAA